MSCAGRGGAGGLPAAAANDVRAIATAVAGGADLEVRDGSGRTPLVVATKANHVEAALALLEAGVPVNHVNDLGWTALHEAIVLGNGSAGHVDTVRQLIAAGAEIDRATA